MRDLSRALGKEVVLRTEGAETELDKTVIEQISDPLVHLIRNCVDHGIESPQAREAAGKPRQGSVHLAARHSGAHVLIQIEDDGAGMDKDALKQKGIDKGLLSPDIEYSDREIFDIIFSLKYVD